MTAWMSATFGVPFPCRPIELLDYLMERIYEPCGFTVPGTILGMVGFFEDVGAIPAIHRLSENQAVKSFVAEAKLELVSANPKAKAKSPPYLTIFISLWEKVVLDDKELCCTRLWAWTKLLTKWGSLRMGDLQGIPAMEIVLDNTGITGTIITSKTTGRGKKVGKLFFHISRDAWTVSPLWLEVGMDIFRETQADRPFLVLLPNAGGTSWSQKEPDYI